jgi:hypothetical protein
MYRNSASAHPSRKCDLADIKGLQATLVSCVLGKDLDFFGQEHFKESFIGVYLCWAGSEEIPRKDW